MYAIKISPSQSIKSGTKIKKDSATVELIFSEGKPFIDDLRGKIEKEIREIMQKNVAKYSLPYEYEFRDKLPKTLVGKVAFKELENEERKKRQ